MCPWADRRGRGFGRTGRAVDNGNQPVAGPGSRSPRRGTGRPAFRPLSWSTHRSVRGGRRRRASSSAVDDAAHRIRSPECPLRGLRPTTAPAAATLVAVSRQDAEPGAGGPPGAGKTTVGRVLARRLGLGFTDVDALIVERAGKPIAAMFTEDGEDAFRALERAVVAEALTADRRRARARRRLGARGGDPGAAARAPRGAPEGRAGRRHPPHRHVHRTPAAGRGEPARHLQGPSRRPRPALPRGRHRRDRDEQAQPQPGRAGLLEALGEQPPTGPRPNPPPSRPTTRSSRTRRSAGPPQPCRSATTTTGGDQGRPVDRIDVTGERPCPCWSAATSAPSCPPPSRASAPPT